MRFEFKERDPEEWLLVQSLTKPFPTVKITEGNIAIALSWFDELRCERGLMECDRVLNTTIKHLEIGKSTLSQHENINHVLATLSASLQYGLNQTKQSCIACMVQVIEYVSEYVSPEVLTEEFLAAIIACMINDDDCSNSFWNGLSRYLPSSLSDNDKDSLLRNECLPALLLSQIQNSIKEGQLRRMYEIGKSTSKPDPTYGFNEFLHQVSTDAITRDSTYA